MKRLVFFLAIALILLACNSPYVPKPKGYFKIDFPAHTYRVFDQPGYPYTFEYPVYANIVKDSMFFNEAPEDPYWINMEFPRFNGKIHISYKQIGRKNNFDQLVTDAFNMAYKQHTLKASAIKDSLISTPNGVGGMFFKLSGNTATGRQFFVTDTTSHFLRGALYFDVTPNEDSLGIVQDFLETDMKKMLNTLKWR